MKLTYRPEIDGLRAIAVLPVILFHAGFSAFGRGFVGVDVFFVISGYLITSIIVTDVAAGTFSYGDFYERRARRILPALFLVMACCIPFAWMWMLPMEMKAFSTSVVSVCLFASNILFWRQSGYFDAAAELKPLLHTWSLAVEEQYYIIFPVAVLLLWRLGRRSLIWSIALIAVLSLALSQYASHHFPSANFYLLPTRAWELMAGALCSFALIKPSLLRDNLLSLAGLAAIATSVFAYDETVPFPSVYALLPVLGACAIILFAQKGTLVRSALSWRPVVGMGLISYSAYLWHQPLFAFARIRALVEPGWTVMLALAALSLALAYLSWRFVEVPARKRGGWPLPDRRAVFAGLGAVALVFVAAGMAGHLSNGFTAFLLRDPDQRDFLAYWDTDLPDRPYFARAGIVEKFGNECDFYDLGRYLHGLASVEPRRSISRTCYTRAPDKKHAVFIWGDSHAQMLRYGLLQSLPGDWQVLQVASSGCAARLTADPQPFCSHSNAVALQAIKDTKPDVVILAQVWGHDAATLKTIADAILHEGVKRVIIMGPTPQWPAGLPTVIVRRFWGDSADRTLTALRPGLFELNDTLKHQLAGNSQITYVSLTDTFCDHDGCLMYLSGDRKRGLVTFDYGHLTPAGSVYVAQHGLVSAITAGVFE